MRTNNCIFCGVQTHSLEILKLIVSGRTQQPLSAQLPIKADGFSFH